MPLAQFQNIPERISDTQVLQLLKVKNVNWKYVNYLKEYSNIKDDLLSDWLNINVKTFRSYKKESGALKENIKEQIILLISLFKHGAEVFGDIENFNQWLDHENFFLDDDKPVNFLKTITGIRFVDDRLTAMEYGDNV